VKAVNTILSNIDGMAFLLEPSREKSGRLGLVFDNQYAHLYFALGA